MKPCPCPARKALRRSLAQLPAHWDLRRLKTVAADISDMSNGRPLGAPCIALEHVESWTGEIKASSSDVSFDSQVKKFRAGDVLFGKLRPYLAKVARPSCDGYCVGEFLVLRPHNGELLAEYLEKLIRSKPVIDAVNASTFGAKMPRADWHFIGNMIQPLPPLAEQGAIVRYLDAADGRIRAYVGAKERLIALLEEERQAVIHRAVTRGLDPNAPLKPSGVEWLSDMPTHWEVRRLRTVAEMRVSNVDKHVKEGELPIRLCNYVDVYKNDCINRDIDFMRATASIDEIERFRLEPGDVLITKDSETWDDIGVPALVTESADDLVCGYHLALLRPSSEMLGPYLALALQTGGVAHQFHIRANGVTRYGLTHTSIKSVEIPLPPLAEQTAIVEHLDKATTAIDATITRARRQVELMQEYRARLIADVVTGKIDVRDT